VRGLKKMHKVLYRFVILYIMVFVILVTVFFNTGGEAARPALYWGASGSNVRLLQWKLQQWGYYDGIIDGIFGTETALAVRDFQRKNRLRVDGIVGPETWAALGDRGEVVGVQRVASGAVNRNDSVEMLARLIHAEARGEPFEGQVAVGAVLLNRVASASFPNSLSGVIYQPLAFESVANGQFNLPPTAENIRAARSAINGWDPTYGSLFFWNPSKPVTRWIWSRPIVRRIGDHVFAL